MIVQSIPNMDFYMERFVHRHVTTTAPSRMVIGNTGGDIDSVSCAIAVADFMNLVDYVHGEKVIPFVPVVNFPSNGLEIRQDVKWWLDMNKDITYPMDDKMMRKPAFLFFDDFKSSFRNSVADFDEPSLNYKTKEGAEKFYDIVLVDHNELDARQTYLNNLIVKVIDHHNTAQEFDSPEKIRFFSSESYTASASSIALLELEKQLVKLNKYTTTYEKVTNLPIDWERKVKDRIKNIVKLLVGPFLIDNYENYMRVDGIKFNISKLLMNKDEVECKSLPDRLKDDDERLKIYKAFDADVRETDKKNQIFHSESDHTIGGRSLDLKALKFIETILSCEDRKQMRDWAVELMKKKNDVEFLLTQGLKSFRNLLGYDEKVFRYNNLIVPFPQLGFNVEQLNKLLPTDSNPINDLSDQFSPYLNERKASFAIFGFGSGSDWGTAMIKHPDFETMLSAFDSIKADDSMNPYVCFAYGNAIFELARKRFFPLKNEFDESIKVGEIKKVDFTGTQYENRNVQLQLLRSESNGFIAKELSGEGLEKFSRKEAVTFWKEFIENVAGKETNIITLRERCQTYIKANGVMALPSFLEEEDNSDSKYINTFLGRIRF